MRPLFTPGAALPWVTLIPLGAGGTDGPGIALGAGRTAVALGTNGSPLPRDALGSHIPGVALGAGVSPHALRPPGALKPRQSPGAHRTVGALVALWATLAPGPHFAP